MDALKDALSAATSDESFDPKNVAKLLHEAAPDVYQAIFQAGHSNASERGNTRVSELEKAISERDSQLESMKNRMKTLEDSKPDISKEIAKYEAALEAAQTRTQELEEELENERNGKTNLARNLNARNFLSSVRSRLENDFGVLGEYAEFAIKKPELLKRLKFDEENDFSVAGAVGADGVTPLHIPEGSSLDLAFANEIARNVPKSFIQDRRQRGSHLGNGRDRGKRIWKESEINALSEKDYAENRDEIRLAMSEGRVQKGA